MYPGLDSLSPFIGRGASNGRVYFLREIKVRDCQPVVKEDFEFSEDIKGKACFLRHLFRRAISSSPLKKNNILYTGRIIGFRETFVLLIKVRKKGREGGD